MTAALGAWVRIGRARGVPLGPSPRVKKVLTEGRKTAGHPRREKFSPREEMVGMSGKRQPTDLIKAKGRKHLSRAEEAARRDGEVPNPTPQGAKIRAPNWLPEDLRAEFNDLRGQLVALGIFAKLDRDTLARYLIAHQIYLRAVRYVQFALDKGDSAGADKWSSVQNKYFKQCRECANDLGLTISSRCKLVLPPKEEDPEVDEFTAFLNRRKAAGDQ